MIGLSEELALAGNARQSIIELISGTPNATQLAWADTTPNWLTRRAIMAKADQFRASLLENGVIEVELHADCGGPDHASRSSSIADTMTATYWCILVPGVDENRFEVVKDGSASFKLDGRRYATELGRTPSVKRSGCPCRPGVRQSDHTRYRSLACPVNPQSRLTELASIAIDLEEAADLASDKRPRSAIREHLLLALIRLERLIVPQTAAEILDGATGLK